MKLSSLLPDLSALPVIEITGLALDSRLVQPGNVFFAYQGAHQDGRVYIDAAIKQGAQVVMLEGANVAIEQRNGVTFITMPNLKNRVGDIAARFNDFPSRKLPMVGVTGTSGKTSCTHFIAAALQQINKSCGLVGTLGNGLYGQVKPGTLTTPDPVILQKTLAELLAEGAEVIAMEVSSHSLDQGRVNGIEFAVGVFTNLSRDHLDYHLTMEAYGAAKMRLFAQTRTAVVNADDEFGREIIATLTSDHHVIAYTCHAPLSDVPCVSAEQIQFDHAGIHAQISSPWGKGALHLPLIGEFNLSNALAALTTLCLLDVPLSQALESLSHLTSVPGRMEKCGGDTKPLVVIDYAHKPDALEKVLLALRQFTSGKLYCVFGCGGDRDRGKRSLMAAIAEQHADAVIVTDDNPRHEDAGQIVADIMHGFKHPERVQVEHDRAKAIRDVIRAATANDCIVIAGKGAETYQQIGDEKLPFSDKEKVLAALLDA